MNGGLAQAAALPHSLIKTNTKLYFSSHGPLPHPNHGFKQEQVNEFFY